MNKPRDRLIAELSNDLEPVKPLVHVSLHSAVWLLLALSAALTLIATHSPFRAEWNVQLLSLPQLLLENLLGLAALISLSAYTFFRATPGHPHQRLAAHLSIITLTAWCAMVITSLIHPATTPSNEGHRLHCAIETIIYAIPALLAGFALLRRRYLPNGWQNGAALGFVSGLTSALIMQLACAYDPLHGLLNHILPAITILTLAGALLGLLKERRNGDL